MVRSIIVALLLALTVGCGQGAVSEKGQDREQGAEPTSKKEVGRPETLILPSLDLHADVVEVGLNDDGSMETPAYDRNQTGWYVEGPKPGEPGPAVVVGHLDNKTGPDVFARLDEIRQGDRVTVIDERGTERAWKVSRVEQVDKDALPYEKVWTDSEKRLLRLVTCAGQYDDEYEDNLIVYANPA